MEDRDCPRCGGFMMQDTRLVYDLMTAKHYALNAKESHLPVKVTKDTCQGCWCIRAIVLSKDGRVIRKMGDYGE